MRKGFMGSMVLRTQPGITLAIAAGSDATSEHLSGLSRMQVRFGCPGGSRLNVTERILQRVPPEFGVETLDDGSLLVSSDLKAAKHFLKSELFFLKQETLAGAWDCTNFAFRARGDALLALHEMAQALPQGRVMFGGLLLRHYLEPAGLILALKDRIPEQYLIEEQERMDTGRRGSTALPA
jgi:hypothetical protein